MILNYLIKILLRFIQIPVASLLLVSLFFSCSNGPNVVLEVEQQKTLIHENAKKMLIEYYEYSNLIGDINEDFSIRKDIYIPQLLNLFDSKDSYVYNDLDPDGKTSASYTITDYLEKLVLWYSNSGVITDLDLENINFGNPTYFEDDTYYINVYLLKGVRGIYLNNKVCNQQNLLEFRIAYNMAKIAPTKFRIVGINKVSQNVLNNLHKKKYLDETPPFNTLFTEALFSLDFWKSYVFSKPPQREVSNWKRIWITSVNDTSSNDNHISSFSQRKYLNTKDYWSFTVLLFFIIFFVLGGFALSIWLFKSTISKFFLGIQLKQKIKNILGKKTVKIDLSELSGEKQIEDTTNTVIADRTNTLVKEQSTPHEMVFVKGGIFQMGSNDSEEEDEKPIHEVTLSDFHIGKYEVTQKQWRTIMGTNPSYFSGCDNCPVESVSWDDVQTFIKKLNQKTGQNYRLPTEAEWEYAAKGGNKSRNYKYSGSNNIDNVGWYSANSGNKTHSVGAKNANELGIYDMSGNVYEWCSDWYDRDYYKSSPRNNPQGPSSGTERVFRGGSWFSYAVYCRVSNRDYWDPDGGGSFFGFRLVLVP